VVINENAVVGEQPILGVDDLLGRYFAGGQTESSGTFTLDPKKALERLAQFQLPGPYHWILKVIQSLHLSGAREIKIEAGVHKVVLTADVVPRGFDAMDDLLTQLLADADRSNPALRHLAAGLQGSLAVQPSQIRLLTISEGEQREYVLQSGGWRDGVRQPVAEKGERFELRLVRNMTEKLGHSWFLLNTDIFDLMLGRRGALDKENKVVFELCDYARCEVLLGSRPATARQFGRPRFKGYDIRSDPSPGKAKPSALSTWFSETDLVGNEAHVQHHLAEYVVPADQPGGFQLEPVSHATLTNRLEPEIIRKSAENGLSRAYALRMDLASSALIYYWEDGVILGRQTLASNCPGLVALIDAKDLGKDLTTLQVLDDERLKLILEDVREVGELLREQVRQWLHLMPAQTLVRQRLGL
jgi:hypothetical protein